MPTNQPKRLPYTAPALSIYGDLKTLTLTVNLNQNKNDSTQGQNNLKT
jgi:hypothetical protein